MVKHYNPTLVEESVRIFNTKTGDHLSSEVANFIQPTVEIRRYADTVATTDRTTTGASTVFTTPADKDWYLTGFGFYFDCDATADSSLYELETTIRGVSTDLFRFRKLSLTAQARQISITLDRPVKVDRNVTILVRQTFTVGASSIGATVFGFTVETTK